MILGRGVEVLGLGRIVLPDRQRAEQCGAVAEAVEHRLADRLSVILQRANSAQRS